MRANDRAVSTEFYNQVVEAYPVIKTNPVYARLFGYFCFGSWRDASSQRLVLSSSLVADAAGKYASWKSRNFRAYDLLEAFRDATGIRMQWSNWDSITGRSRVLTAFPVPEHIRAAIRNEEQQICSRNDMVCLTDGTKYNLSKQRAWREADRTNALERLAESNCGDAVALGTYLNTQPPNRYTSLLSNMEAAMFAACNLDKPTSSKHQLSVLRAIRDQPTPFYTPSSRGRTIRLFGYNESLLALTKRVRIALSPEWRSADLRSAQLAIAATQWNIPLVKEFLGSELNVWVYLFEELGLEKTDERKRAVKDALYAVLYGREPGFTSYMLTRSLAIQGIGARFLRIPLVEALFCARERMFERVKKDGGMTDAYGRWIALMDSSEVPRGLRVSAASVLSQCAQAMEMRLLSPVIQSAIEERDNPHGWSLTLWKHDGFNWSPNKQDDRDKWANRLKAVVQAQAESYSVHTHLEID